MLVTGATAVVDETWKFEYKGLVLRGLGLLMLVSLSVVKIVAILAQLYYRSALRPITEAMDHATWEACLYPGGYR